MKEEFFLAMKFIAANFPHAFYRTDKGGTLPRVRFNTVIDAALARQGLSRLDIYVTQTFHLVPRKRSERISQAAIRRSFDEVTRFELQGRKVIALGDIAAAECARHAIEHIAVCHPSRRRYTNEKNATEIADAICALGFGRAVKENPSTG